MNYFKVVFKCKNMGIEHVQLNIKYLSITINVNNSASNQHGTDLLCILMCNHTALFFLQGESG